MYNDDIDRNLDGTGLKEACGVFGIYDFDGQDVVSTIYYGLLRCSTEDRRAAGSQSARRADRKEK